MRYVAAALLLQLAGEEASAEKIEKILGSVGVECDKENMDLVLNNIKGKNIEELIAEGAGKLASVGGGGGGGAAPAAAAAPADEAPAAKKEEKKEESEEEDDDMGFGLFD